jgi:hypothetical protein
LGAQTDRIFSRDAGVNLPAWQDGWDEAFYNAHVVESLGGFLLDKRLIYTDLHRRGIEVCDVLLPDGTLVHIKSIEKSAPATTSLLRRSYLRMPCCTTSRHGQPLCPVSRNWEARQTTFRSASSE